MVLRVDGKICVLDAIPSVFIGCREVHVDDDFKRLAENEVVCWVRAGQE